MILYALFCNKIYYLHLAKFPLFVFVSLVLYLLVSACQTVPLLEDEEEGEEEEKESKPRTQSAASHSILAENRSKRFRPRRASSGKRDQPKLKEGSADSRQSSFSETESKHGAVGNRDSVTQTGTAENDKERVESTNDNDGPTQINRSDTG